MDAPTETDHPGCFEPALYTIGHSNHQFDAFLALLTQHGVTAIADVRSSPHSAYNPQFNREALAEGLKRAGIEYVFLGRELGARREEPEVYNENGQVQFAAVAQTPLFRAGIERVVDGMQRLRVALMCAEKDPLTCHRMMLICRYFPPLSAGTSVEEFDIRHIREDGSIETHVAAESRLLALCKLPERDLFRTREELLEEAYERQETRVAYVERPPAVSPHI